MSVFGYDGNPLTTLKSWARQLKALNALVNSNLKSLSSIKTGHVFSTELFDTGMVWHNGKTIWGKVFPDVGALPNATSLAISHKIANIDECPIPPTGTALNPSNGTLLTLPYSSPTLTSNVSLYMDIDTTSNIYILTGANLTAYTDTTITVYVTLND